MKKLGIVILLITVAAFTAKAQGTLNIYGGKNHDQFLGCMNCNNEKPNSIWSPFTDYGSSHNPKSIWNERGLYGSVKSNYSPYNPKAKYPPQIVDGNGKCVGYLTVNKNNPGRIVGKVADLICFKRDMVLKDGVEKYAEIFSQVH
jgi:hypothetical protein